MISELFGLLAAVDVTGKGANRKLGLKANLNRNRIRSISAFSSNSIFYFPCIVSDQCMPEEVGMISRMIEKSYASFVVACIALMPFHRVRSDDQASIEEYLSQFHQNIGMNGGSGAAINKAFRIMDALPMKESFTEAEQRVGDWLLECWHKSLEENSDFVKIVGSEVSLNDMFNESAIDEKTRVIQAKYHEIQDEMNTWGFLGEASDDLFDIEDILDNDDEDDDDEDYDENEFGDDILDESSFDDVYNNAEKAINSVVATAALGNSNTMIQVSRVISAATTEEELKKAQKFAYKYALVDPITGLPITNTVNSLEKKTIDTSVERQRKRITKKAAKQSMNEGIIRLAAQGAQQATDSIKFALESVSENKILSCQSLTKLSSLESKLKKLKNKYTKYLNRYKKKWKENKEKGTNSKLAIRFNNLSIRDPKAFMKQYGEYIKIINKRLKLVEKRRAELRKRKGIKSESAIPDMLTSLEFDTLEYCDRVISESLAAPDDEIFTILDEDTKDDLITNQRRIIRSHQDQHNLDTQEIDRLMKADSIKDREIYKLQRQADSGQQSTRIYKDKYNSMVSRVSTANDERRAAEARTSQLEKERSQLIRDFNAARGADKARYKAELDQKNAEIAALKNGDPLGRKASDSSSDDGSRIDVDYLRNRPQGGVDIRYAKQRKDGKFTTYSKEIFTDMEMKKANEAIPIFTKADIGFVIDETEEVVTRDVLIGIKAYIHRAPSAELVNDIYNCIINKRKFLKFVKFITGEERSLADLMFGFKELRTDALDAKSSSGEWRSAFKRRRRWSKMSIPYLTKEYTPNGTIVMTMNEVEFIRDQYGIDIMRPDHVSMIMDADYLLGFVIVDQANEMVYVTYDGHGYGFQQYTYAMLEREQVQSDRMMRELYRAMAR